MLTDMRPSFPGLDIYTYVSGSVNRVKHEAGSQR